MGYKSESLAYTALIKASNRTGASVSKLQSYILFGRNKADREREYPIRLVKKDGDR